jgi:hypothetical protein
MAKAWSEVTVMKGADYTIEVGVFKYSVEATYSGELREIGARRDLLHRWGKTLDLAPQRHRSSRRYGENRRRRSCRDRVRGFVTRFISVNMPAAGVFGCSIVPIADRQNGNSGIIRFTALMRGLPGRRTCAPGPERERERKKK